MTANLHTSSVGWLNPSSELTRPIFCVQWKKQWMGKEGWNTTSISLKNLLLSVGNKDEYLVPHCLQAPCFLGECLLEKQNSMCFWLCVKLFEWPPWNMMHIAVCWMAGIYCNKGFKNLVNKLSMASMLSEHCMWHVWKMKIIAFILLLFAVVLGEENILFSLVVAFKVNNYTSTCDFKRW